MCPVFFGNRRGGGFRKKFRGTERREKGYTPDTGGLVGDGGKADRDADAGGTAAVTEAFRGSGIAITDSGGGTGNKFEINSGINAGINFGNRL